jgi:hypothetical protein
MKKWLLVPLLVFMCIAFSSLSHAEDKVPDNFGAKGALNDDNITIQKALNYALQDEYLSQTRYDIINETFGYDIRPFPLLQYANRRVIQTLYRLCDEQDIPILKNNNDIVFYLDVPRTVKEALQEEINFENQNISMYHKFVNQTELPEEIKAVFEQLKEKSRDHLRELRIEYNRY